MSRTGIGITRVGHCRAARRLPVHAGDLAPELRELSTGSASLVAVNTPDRPAESDEEPPRPYAASRKGIAVPVTDPGPVRATLP